MRAIPSEVCLARKFRLAHLIKKPCPRARPKALNGADRDAKFLRGEFLGETHEKAKLHDFRRARIEDRESIERLIHGEQLVRRHRQWNFNRIEINRLVISAALEPAFAAR